MTIKQSILLLLLSLGVSFSVFSASDDLYTVTFQKNGSIKSCLAVGSTYSDSHIRSMRCDYGASWEVYSCSPSYNRIYCYNTYNYDKFHAYDVVQVSSCPSGQSLNPLTGKCEEACPEGTEKDPLTGECKPIPFCDLDSTNDQIFEAEQSCAAQGGIFSFQCHNGDQVGFPQGLTTNCVQPNECVMGYPNWPDCLGDLDPTDPLPDPDSNFDSGTADPITPDNPSFDKTEPDAVTPTDTTDTAVLEAVQNLNRDTNQGFTALNADMNQGFNDVNNQLNRLNQTNNAIGQSIVDQMNQDYRAHLAQKGLLLQQTGAINNGMSSIVKSIGEQTGTLNDSLTGIGEKLDELNLNIKDAAPCDPNEDPLSCEGEHGLGEPTVGTINTQINHAVEGMFEESEAGMIGAVQGYVDDAGVSSIQTHIDGAIGLAMGALPNISDCTSFSLPTPFGDSIDFGCEFSVKFKAVASFLMYIYTAWTLIDILLTGVTPAAGTVPYMSRR